MAFPKIAQFSTGFLAAASQSVETISRQLEDDVLDRSVDILAGAETIFLLARRRSYPITAYMAYAFGKLKIRNQLIRINSRDRS